MMNLVICIWEMMLWTSYFLNALFSYCVDDNGKIEIYCGSFFDKNIMMFLGMVIL
jgi:hypothetical protein